VGWGKAVPLPPAPVYMAPEVAAASEAAGSQLPFGATPSGDVFVGPPRDRALRLLIHRVVERVLTHGPEFEALLLQRTLDQPAVRRLVCRGSRCCGRPCFPVLNRRARMWV
jgi:hypothetical protein